jgi:hypothetical protein
MFICIPKAAHRSSIELILEYFSVLTPSCGSSQGLSAEVMDYWIDKIQYTSMSL